MSYRHYTTVSTAHAATCAGYNDQVRLMYCSQGCSKDLRGLRLMAWVSNATASGDHCALLSSWNKSRLGLYWMSSSHVIRIPNSGLMYVDARRACPSLQHGDIAMTDASISWVITGDLLSLRMATRPPQVLDISRTPNRGVARSCLYGRGGASPVTFQR